MKHGWILLIMVLLSALSCENRPAPSPSVQPPPKTSLEREAASQEPSVPADVKIKLKRDGKEQYSWEISGSDVDQVLKINDKLRKRVGGEQAK